MQYSNQVKLYNNNNLIAKQETLTGCANYNKLQKESSMKKNVGIARGKGC
jgi:hypothetical protein